MFRFWTLLTILILVLSSLSHTNQIDSSAWLNQVDSTAGIYFSDAGEHLVLGNATWEVAFRKTNGGLVYITDKLAGGQLTIGSRGECLWGASDMTLGFYIGGCSYHKDGSNRFSYAWDANAQVLTLTYRTYVPSPEHFQATVRIFPSAGKYFDMDIQVQNDYSDGKTFDYILFPSDLIFRNTDIQAVLLPLLPGVVLKPGFFTEHRIYYWNYPGYPGAFADYIAYSTSHGELAIYAWNPSGALPVTQAGLNNDYPTQADTFYASHNFGVMLKGRQSWTSPKVRLRIGESWTESIKGYRIDNQLDRYPSTAAKLGKLYSKVIHMPEYRLVSFEVSRKFSEYDSLFFSNIRTPAILHVVGFQPVGHDHYYPDFLPPDTRWCNVAANCTQEFANMFDQAKSRGWLVMPYTNPTFWTVDAPTLNNLPAPLTIKDISVQDEAGNPQYECYGPNCGYAVSPYVPYVGQRLEQLMNEMTITVPSDMIFEDQIGARPWMFDFNSSEPSPTAYIQGWLEHVQQYKGKYLATELAFDRLAEYETAFYGSILLPQKLGQTNTNFGDANWYVYPLAQMLARDKSLFYQHDLDLNTFSDTKYNILWNLAMGYNLGDDLRLTEGDVHANPWLKLNGELQDHLLADYAGERVTAFNDLASSVTETRFQTVRVIANWNTGESYTTQDGHTLPAYGALVQAEAGWLTAGIFSAFNGQPLSAGDHYLIVKQVLNTISVRQPMGADTSLSLPLPADWDAGDPLEIWAYDINGAKLGALSWTVDGRGITFTMTATVGGQEVEQVVISNPNVELKTVYLPLVVR